MIPTDICQGDTIEHHRCHAEQLDNPNIPTQWNRSSLLMNDLTHFCLYLVGFFLLLGGLFFTLLQEFSVLLIATQVLLVQKVTKDELSR